jgi:hypothetical protein
MSFDWLKALAGGAAGAAGGAVAGNLPGAIIGGGLGLTKGFAGSDDEQEQLYRDLLNKYADAGNGDALAKLDEISKTGMGPADRAAILRGYSDAGTFARGREGVAAQRDEMMGGVGRQGGSQLAQDQSAQAATQRAYLGGLEQTSAAAQRRMQATQLAMQERARNQQALNNYRLAATGKLADQLGAEQESRNQALSAGANAVGAAGGYLANKYLGGAPTIDHGMQTGTGGPSLFIPGAGAQDATPRVDLSHAAGIEGARWSGGSDNVREPDGSLKPGAPDAFKPMWSAPPQWNPLPNLRDETPFSGESDAAWDPKRKVVHPGGM